MTKDELNALPSGTLLHIPSSLTFTVNSCLFYGRVGTTDYYTFTQSPDDQGVISYKKPFWFHALDLLHATTDEQQAYKTALNWLEEQKQSIVTTKLKPDDGATSTVPG